MLQVTARANDEAKALCIVALTPCPSRIQGRLGADVGGAYQLFCFALPFEALGGFFQDQLVQGFRCRTGKWRGRFLLGFHHPNPVPFVADAALFKNVATFQIKGRAFIVRIEIQGRPERVLGPMPFAAAI